MCSPSASVSAAPVSAGGSPFRTASCPSWHSLFGVFARLERPIPFDAFDDRPVDLIFVLLAPADAGAEHLRALARVSRLLRDDAIRQKLRGTDNPDALYAL